MTGTGTLPRGEQAPTTGSSRRELVLAVVLCGAGAGLIVGLAGRTWATAAEDAGAGMTPLLQPLTGSTLSGVPAAFGWAGLAGLAALFATRGRLRVGVGVLLTVFGVGAAIASTVAVRHAHVLAAASEKSNFAHLGADVTVRTNAWWVGSLAGGVLLAAAGVVTVVRGRRWPGMSAKYDAGGVTRPARESAPDDPAALWRSLDRGEDPTRIAEKGP